MAYVSPTPLRKGDTVAIIAPSSPISDTSEIKAGLAVLEELGLKYVLGPNVLKMRSDNWSSASVEDRVEEIEWAYEDEDIDAVIVAEGGYSSMQLLPHLPYELMSENRKVFLGMSDVTTINCALLAKCNVVNFSGPNLRIRKDVKGDEYNLVKCIKMLYEDRTWDYDAWLDSDTFPRCICDGIAKGPAIGGNLTLFTSLLGTPYFPECKDAVLFFEDIHSAGWEVSINLNRLDLAGVFDKVAGVVLGEFVKQPKRADQDLPVEDVLVRFFSDRLPCIYGMPFSHGAYSSVIPLGVDTLVDAEKCTVLFGNPYEKS